VQALRALAALIVVFVHLDKLLAGVGARPFGVGGVDIFFVISGFIMVYTTIDRRPSPRSFLANRIARIVPIYWVMTLGVFTIALTAPELLLGTKANCSELLKSLAFIPFAKTYGVTQPVLYVGWTLNYEMFFYAVFAVGLLFGDRRMGAAGVIFSLACLVGVGVMEQPQGVVASFYTQPIMLEFAFGMLIGLFHRKAPLRAATPLKLATLLLVIAGVAAAAVLPTVLPKMPELLVCGLPATAVVGGAVALERWEWTISTRLWLLLGNASYSIYLTHPFVTQTAQKIFAPLEARGVLAFLLIIITLASVCFVGVIAHYFLERPLSKILSRNFRKLADTSGFKRSPTA
jgi:exopolysaccharide production protein ExoZ